MLVFPSSHLRSPSTFEAVYVVDASGSHYFVAAKFIPGLKKYRFTYFNPISHQKEAVDLNESQVKSMSGERYHEFHTKLGRESHKCESRTPASGNGKVARRVFDRELELYDSKEDTDTTVVRWTPYDKRYLITDRRLTREDIPNPKILGDKWLFQSESPPIHSILSDKPDSWSQVRRINRGRNMVVKIHYPPTNMGLTMDTIHELDIATRFSDHPNIMPIRHVQWGVNGFNFENKSKDPVELWTMEANSGTLDQFIKTWFHDLGDQDLDLVVCSLTQQLLQVLRDLETHSILVGNLRPKHILLHKRDPQVQEWQLLLTDFGTTEFIDDELEKRNWRLDEQTRKSYYQAWEVFEPYHLPLVGFKSDMFSAAMVLFEVCTGRSFVELMQSLYDLPSQLDVFEWLRTGRHPLKAAEHKKDASEKYSEWHSDIKLHQHKKYIHFYEGWSSQPSFPSQKGEDAFLEKVIQSAVGSASSFPSLHVRLRITPGFWTDTMVPLLVKMMRWTPLRRASASEALDFLGSHVDFKKAGLPVFPSLRSTVVVAAETGPLVKWEVETQALKIASRMRYYRDDRNLLLTQLLVMMTQWHTEMSSRFSCRTYFQSVMLIDRTFIAFYEEKQQYSVSSTRQMQVWLHCYLFTIVWLSAKITRDLQTTALRKEILGPLLTMFDEVDESNWIEAILEMERSLAWYVDGRWTPEGTAMWHSARQPSDLVEWYVLSWDVVGFWTRISSPSSSSSSVDGKSVPFQKVKVTEESIQPFFGWTMGHLLWGASTMTGWKCTLVPEPYVQRRQDNSFNDKIELDQIQLAWLPILEKITAPMGENVYHRPEAETRRMARNEKLAIPIKPSSANPIPTIREFLQQITQQVREEMGEPPSPYASQHRLAALQQRSTKPPAECTSFVSVDSNGLVSPNIQLPCFTESQQSYHRAWDHLIHPYRVAVFASPSRFGGLGSSKGAPVYRRIKSIQYTFDVSVDGKTSFPKYTLDSPLPAEIELFLRKLFLETFGDSSLLPHIEVTINAQVTLEEGKTGVNPDQMELTGWLDSVPPQSPQNPSPGPQLWIGRQWVRTGPSYAYQLSYLTNTGKDDPVVPWGTLKPASLGKLIAEIVSSEHVLVRNLLTLIETYFTEVAIHPQVYKSASREAYLKFKPYFTNILTFHHELLDRLNASQNILQLLQALEGFFTFDYLVSISKYSAMTNTTPEALGPFVNRMNQFSKESLEFSKLIRQQKFPSIPGIFSLMMEPIQRPPRYKLLLEELANQMEKALKTNGPSSPELSMVYLQETQNKLKTKVLPKSREIGSSFNSLVGTLEKVSQEQKGQWKK